MRRHHFCMPVGLAAVSVAALLAASCERSVQQPARVSAPARTGQSPAWVVRLGLPTAQEAFALAPQQIVRVRDWTTPGLVLPIRGGFALVAAVGDVWRFGGAGLVVTYFHRDGGRWRVGRQWAYPYGPQDKVADAIEVLSASADGVVVTVSRERSAKSGYAEVADVVELTGSGPQRRAVAIPVETDQGEGEADHLSVAGLVSPLVGAPGLEVHYRGHLCRQMPVDRSVRYIPRQGGAWVPDGPPLAASCPPGAWPYPAGQAAFDLVPNRLKRPEREEMKPDLVTPTRDGFALLMLVRPIRCPGCAQSLSVAYFGRGGPGGWRFRRLWRDVIANAQAMEVVQIGAYAPTVALYRPTAIQGCFTTWLDLVELSPAGPVARLRSAPLGSDNDWQAGNDGQRFHFVAAILPPAAGRGLRIRYVGFTPGGRRQDRTIAYGGRGPTWTPHGGRFRWNCVD